MAQLLDRQSPAVSTTVGQGMGQPASAPTVPVTGATAVPQPSIVITHPALAPGVQLLGEAQGTGFAKPMWLIQYHNRFIQVTELLYRVAEFADGSRTCAEIAAEVSRVSQWQMNADDVKFLIANRLFPKGLIAVPAKDDEDASPAPTQREAQSLLQLGLQRRVIGPDVIEPIARRLQYFFTPAVLIPLLIAGAIAEGWLYLDHGVGGVLSHILYTPGLLLLTFGMMIFPSFWHEFGHAAALRYGGGRARSIGVGIYIMDAAFYTDVTDGYRLSRGARVRTGFGGVYFDLLLATSLITAYLFTGYQVLLLLAFLRNLNTVYQFFPLIRLDGYWILADFVGVPDFYSLMGAFIRRVLPVPWWRGPKLPHLKRWVKIFFAFYTTVALPGLVIFLYLLIRHIPAIATESWNALRSQADDFPAAVQGGHWLTAAALASQTVLIAVTLIGLTYFVVLMSRSYLRLLWQIVPAIVRRLHAAPAVRA